MKSEVFYVSFKPEGTYMPQDLFFFFFPLSVDYFIDLFLFFYLSWKASVACFFALSCLALKHELSRHK